MINVQGVQYYRRNGRWYANETKITNRLLHRLYEWALKLSYFFFTHSQITEEKEVAEQELPFSVLWEDEMEQNAQSVTPPA